MSTATAAAMPDDDRDDQGNGLPADLRSGPKDAAMVLHRGDTVTSLQALNVDEIEALLDARDKTLVMLRDKAIKGSRPLDWTLFQGSEGGAIAVPRDSMLVNVRKWLGISISNYRPNPNGIPSPLVSEEVKSGGTKVIVVEMWADGHCSFTNERIEGVYFAIRSDQGFAGRTIDNVRNGMPTLQDMKASCRTGLDSKVTRILAGLRKVDVTQLDALGVDSKKAYKGPGFGSSSERTAGKATDEDASALLPQLIREVTQATGGDEAAAKKLLKEITANPTKGFGGFDSYKRLTQKWQVENALKALHAHPMFGESVSNDGDAGA